MSGLVVRLLGMFMTRRVRLLASGLFDAAFYLAQNPDVTQARMDPARHYLDYGGAEGRSSHPLFDSNWYWRQVAANACDLTPLEHYLSSGADQGLSPHPLFNPRHYARAAGVEGLARREWFFHFLRQGEARGISPHPLIDLRRLAQGYGLAEPAAGLLAKFAADASPPCSPHPLFDVDFYLKRYPEVAQQKINPLVHYVKYDALERRNPSLFLDADFYLAQLSRPIGPGMTGLQHYVEVGALLGFAPSLRFDPYAFASRHPEATRDGGDLLEICLRLYQGTVPEEFCLSDGTLREGPAAVEASGASQNAKRPGDARATARISGNVEKVSRSFLTGWAIDLQSKATPVQLNLFIDGVLFASTETRLYRGDEQTIHGGIGFAGFSFELPPNLDNDEPVSIEVRARMEPQNIKNAFSLIQPVPIAKRTPSRGHGRIYLGPGISAGTRINADRGSAPFIAIIVLNLDGADLLRAFFETFLRFNSYNNVEVLVVDHASRDNSREVVREYAEVIRVRLLARDANYSSSDSNNWAAQQTDADILIFTNNDIEFCQDVIAGIRDALADDTVGIAGIKLLDKPMGRRTVAGHTVQHVGVYLRADAREGVVSAFDARPTSQFEEALHRVIDVPGVTGAFIACRSADFSALGGFDPAYSYGYEDVDLFLRFTAILGKRVVCANHLTAIHHRGVTRNDPAIAASSRTRQDWTTLEAKLGYWLRKKMARDLFRVPGFWTSLVPKIGFAVTDARDCAAAGDYFTALELALELERLTPCKAIFLEKGLGNWYDVNGLDVLIVMRDDYDLSRLTNRSPRLITIGWARNWIDRWPKRPWAQDYQGYWASSMKAANYLAKSLARPVEVVPIATSRASFTDGVSRGELKSDYCFTGNYWGAPRDIADLLKPETIPFQFALFGYGWENHPTFAKFARGGLPYSRMKDVYASTRVVIDDANSATKQWGSVNSRVFDALAAGALVITNGEEGAGEIFGGLLPTYRSAEELTAVLTHYLTDEAGRVTLVEQLRRVVSNANTYGHRANVVRQNLLRLSENQLRFAIKIGAPNQSVLDEWGGYHFAVGIQRSLARLGHSARIDCLDQWNRADAVGDDIVIVLRGLSKYEPQVHQINVMWNISHPDKVSDDEYESYDHVFVASKRHARSLASRLSTPVSALLQCTDPEIFNPDVPPQERHEVLFVGNSCKVLHRIVRDALSAGLPLSVFGRRWEGIIPPNHIKGTRIPNQQLAGYYVSAGAVLNDHWDSMQQHGFISNRLFDAAACGARIVSDRIEGLDEVFGTLVLQYDEPAALKLAIERLMSEISPDRDKRLSLARHVIEHHNFDVRAQSILAVVYDHDRRKTSLFPGG